MNKRKIKADAKGKFSAWARSHGMTVQEAANRILRNSSQYSPTLIKRANFARNASKWEDGGIMLGVSDTKRKKGPFTLAKLPSYGTGGNIFKTLGGAAATAIGTGLIATGIGAPAGAALTSAGVGMMGSGVKGFGDDANTKRNAETGALVNAQDMADYGQASIGSNYPKIFNKGGMFKGKKFGFKKGGATAIVGGGELVMSPDGVLTNMKGPTDMNGGKGIPVDMPDGTMIINKKDSKGILPLAGKINKNKTVLEGGGSMLSKNSSKKNLNKYYSKVLDVYNKQEAKKFAKGGKFDGGGYTFGDSWQKPNTMFGDKYQTDFGLDEFNIGNSNWYDDSLMSTKFPTSQGQPQVRQQNVVPTTTGRSTWGGNIGGMNQHLQSLIPQFGPAKTEFGKANPVDNTLAGAPNIGDIPQPDDKFGWSDIGELAPTIYNAAQGIFGKRQHLNANDYSNPYEGQINSLMANRRYNIDPSLAANEATFRTTAANMRNLGGSRGQVMSNLTGVQNTKQFGDMSAYSQKNNMDNQYRAEQAQALYPLGRDTAMTNMAVDDSNMMTDASGRNMLGSSMTGLQQYLLTKRQMKGQEKRDKMLAGAIRAYGSGYANKWLGSEFSNYRG